MWISLSPLVATLDFSDASDSVAAIETILSSARRGEHIVFADRKTLSHLLSLGLSLPNQAVVKSIQSRYSELASIEAQQIFRVKIDPTIQQPHYEGANVWLVPLQHFANVALVPSCVLAEDLRDATAYVTSAQHALLLHGHKGIKVNLTKDSGGGAAIPNKLKDLALSKRQFVLAITDTDKTHPRGACCAPTSKCAAIAAQTSWVVEHQMLDASEIENILPVNLISDSVEDSTAAHALAERLDFLKMNVFKNRELGKWFDLKNGTKLAKIKTTNDNEPEKAHWVNASVPIRNVFGCGIRCQQNAECPEGADKECACLLLPGLGDETLERFNSYCAKLTLHKQCERVRTSVNSADWLSLGSKIASWGAALEKQRS